MEMSCMMISRDDAATEIQGRSYGNEAGLRPVTRGTGRQAQHEVLLCCAVPRPRPGRAVLRRPAGAVPGRASPGAGGGLPTSGGGCHAALPGMAVGVTEAGGSALGTERVYTLGAPAPGMGLANFTGVTMAGAGSMADQVEHQVGWLNQDRRLH